MLTTLTSAYVLDPLTPAEAKERITNPSRAVIVEESTRFPGCLSFTPLVADREFLSRHHWFLSVYGVLSDLGSLSAAVQSLRDDGYEVVALESARGVLAAHKRYSRPLEVDGLTVPNGGTLFPYQQFCLRRVFEQAERLPKRGGFFASLDTGLGKAQPVSEPVLTPSGWRTMGELRVGDRVIGSNGRPTEVLGVYPQGERQVYRVTMSDGSFVRCDREHLWTVRTKSDKYRGRDFRTLTAGQIAERVHQAWQLPMPEPIRHEGGVLPMDPYALGVLLGDGSLHPEAASVTTDTWIVNHLGWEPKPHPSDGVSDSKVPRETKEALSRMGLLGCRSWEKFVPPEYMVATSEDRLSLLQGLLDTDAYPMPDGGVEFSSTSANLIESVTDLARSLGGVVRGHRRAAATYEYRGERRTGRPAWRINIKLPGDTAAFRLPRKSALHKRPTKYQPAKIIRSVEAEGVCEQQVCIEVAAEDSLYITRGYALTHNTLVAAGAIQRLVVHGDYDLAVVLGPSALTIGMAKALESSTEAEVVRIDGAKAARRRQYESATDVAVTNFHKARFDRDEFVAMVRGKRVLFVLDEVQQVLRNGHRRTLLRRALDDVLSAPRSSFVLPMSATVVGRNPLRYHDVFSLMNERNPLGTRTHFRRRYGALVDNGFEPVVVWNHSLLEEVRHRIGIQAQFTRKTDPGVREMFTGLQTIVEKVYLSPEERALYRAVATAQAEERALSGEAATGAYGLIARAACQSMTAVGRIDSDRARALAEEHPAKGVSTKHGQAAEKVGEIVGQGDQVVVFTAFTHLGLEQFAEALDKQGVPYAVHHGGQTAKANHESVERFTSGQVPVLLSSDAGAFGLNLQCARYVVHLEPPTAFDIYKQRTDRIDRVDSFHDGLTSIVYVTDGTIEEGHWERMEATRILSSATSGATEVTSRLSAEEIERLQVLANSPDRLLTEEPEEALAAP